MTIKTNYDPTINNKDSAIKRFVDHPKFQNFIICLISLNAIILGMETSSSLMNSYGTILRWSDRVILLIFTSEIALRIYAYRFRFFKSPWSLFDLFVVAIAYIPASEAFAALRTLRVLRVLRLISSVPSMRKVVVGLLNAIPGIMSVCSILILFFYIFAVIGTHLYGATFPDWFGNLGRSMFTLFQIMTLESWSMGIVRPVMAAYPYAWIYFVLYILVATFTMLNLFIAIIVNAMHSTADQEADQKAAQNKTDTVAALTAEIRALEERILKQINNQKS